MPTRAAPGVSSFSRKAPEELGPELLVSLFGAAEDPVSKRNSINAVCRRLGVGGRDRREITRVVAEAWQWLEHEGLICVDPEQSLEGWWFLTRAGVVRRDEWAER